MLWILAGTLPLTQSPKTKTVDIGSCFCAHNRQAQLDAGQGVETTFGELSA